MPITASQSPLAGMMHADEALNSRMESQLKQAAQPYALEQIPLEAQARKDQFKVQSLESQLKSQAARDALIANAATKAESAADWDEAMTELSNNGIKEAGQYVGRYTEKLRDRIRSAGDMASQAGARASKGGGGGGGLAGAADGGMTPETVSEMLANLPPEKIKELAQTSAAMAAALNRVYGSQNPSAQWDIEVAKLGRPDLAGQYSRENMNQYRGMVDPIHQVMEQRGIYAQLGLQVPRPQPDITASGGQLWSIRKDPLGGDPTAKALTPREERSSFDLIGTTEDGRGIYANRSTGEEKIGENALHAKPAGVGGGRGGGGKASVFEQKRAAWLESHPDDPQGALDYAAGLKGKQLSPSQALRSAETQAQKELDSLVLAGDPPEDPSGFLKERSQALYQNIMAVDAEGSAPPRPAYPRAPTAPAGSWNIGAIKGASKAQADWLTANSKKAASVKAGPGKSPDRPVVPTTEAQYNAIPSGTYYLHHSGVVKKKP